MVALRLRGAVCIVPAIIGAGSVYKLAELPPAADTC